MSGSEASSKKSQPDDLAMLVGQHFDALPQPAAGFVLRHRIHAGDGSADRKIRVQFVKILGFKEGKPGQ